MCAFLYATSEIAGATWIGEYFGDPMLVDGKLVRRGEVLLRGGNGRERAAPRASPCPEK
jgi:hypothetical protein